jgi:hypothetical protein
MKEQRNWQFLLAKDTDLRTCEACFAPYSLFWERREEISEGSLYYAEDVLIAFLRYYVSENRLEVYTIGSQEELLMQFFEHPPFLALFQNPVNHGLDTLYKAIKQSNSLEQQLALVRQFCFLAKFVLPLLDASLRKRIRLLCKRQKKLAKELVVASLFATYGLQEFLDRQKLETTRQKFEQAFLGIDWEEMASLTQQCAFMLGQFPLEEKELKAQRSLVESVQKVHSENDVKALKKVYKAVKRRLDFRSMSNAAPAQDLLQLEEVLGSWYSLIVFQDRLLKLDNPPMTVMQVMVKVQLDIQIKLDAFRALTSELWEDSQ